jgi:thiosulfate/3-mercaptopyruvate sulfurtransferase
LGSFSAKTGLTSGPTLDLFLLHRLGFDDLTLYDGSMGEWAKDPALPIEKG